MTEIEETSAAATAQDPPEVPAAAQPKPTKHNFRWMSATNRLALCQVGVSHSAADGESTFKAFCDEVQRHGRAPPPNQWFFMKQLLDCKAIALLYYLLSQRITPETAGEVTAHYYLPHVPQVGSPAASAQLEQCAEYFAGVERAEVRRDVLDKYLKLGEQVSRTAHANFKLVDVLKHMKEQQEQKRAAAEGGGGGEDEDEGGTDEEYTAKSSSSRKSSSKRVRVVVVESPAVGSGSSSSTTSGINHTNGGEVIPPPPPPPPHAYAAPPPHVSEDVWAMERERLETAVRCAEQHNQTLLKLLDQQQKEREQERAERAVEREHQRQQSTTQMDLVRSLMLQLTQQQQKKQQE